MLLPLPVKALWGTFGTWLKAFNGPCLWACLAAAGLAGWGAGVLTYKIQDARVARAEANLSKFDKQLADSTASTMRYAFDLSRDLQHQVDLSVSAAVAELSGKIALSRDTAALERVAQNIEELKNDPRLACRSLPLPNQYLDSLRLP